MIDMVLEENLESKSEFTFVVRVSVFLNKVSLTVFTSPLAMDAKSSFEGQMIRWKLAIH